MAKEHMVTYYDFELSKRVFGKWNLTYLDKLLMGPDLILKFKKDEDYLEFDIPNKELPSFLNEIYGRVFTIILVGSHMGGDFLTIKLRSPREDNKSLIRDLFEKRGISLEKAKELKVD